MTLDQAREAGGTEGRRRKRRGRAANEVKHMAEKKCIWIGKC